MNRREQRRIQEEEGENEVQNTIVSSTRHFIFSDFFRKFYYSDNTQYTEEFLYIQNPDFRINHMEHQFHLYPAIEMEAPVKSNLSTTQAALSVFGIFACSLIAVAVIYLKFPELDPSERKHMKIPWDIEDAKQLGAVLDRYKDLYFMEVLSGICVVYIFLQTFAIPGSLFLSILSGFLFPFPVAIGLVCICSAVGASLCFLLSQLLGRRLVNSLIPERTQQWSKTIEKHKDNLFNYMLFLRMTPILPNWFINLVAPVVGVPLIPFALGTFFGVMPPSILAIQAGQTLHTLTGTDAFSWRSMLLLAGIALVCLIPVFLKGKLKKKFE